MSEQPIRTLDEIRAKLGNIPPGKRVGGDPISEADNFQVCPGCGQAFDRRELAQVPYHDQPGHPPTDRQ